MALKGSVMALKGPVMALKVLGMALQKPVTVFRGSVMH